MDITKLLKFMKNKYFYGKLMTVRDFEEEQKYFDEKRHLLNRLISGYGLVYGLDVKEVDVNNSKYINFFVEGGKVRVEFKKNGVALDHFGNEIVIPKDEIKDITFDNGAPLLITNMDEKTIYIYLKYKEEFGELVTAASSSSNCEEACCPNKIIEKFDVIASEKFPEEDEVNFFNNQTTLFPDFPVYEDRFTSYENPDPEYKLKVIQKIKEWTQSHIGKYSLPMDATIFLAAIQKDALRVNTIIVDNESTIKYSSFIYNNPLLAKLLCQHLTHAADDNGIEVEFSEGNKYIVDDKYKIKNKHVSDLDVYRWNRSVIRLGDVKIDGDEDVMKGIELIPGEGIDIQYDDIKDPDIAGDPYNTITIINSHATGTQYQVDPYASDESADFQSKNKHVSNEYAQHWHSAIYSINKVIKTNLYYDEGTGRVLSFNSNINIVGDPDRGIEVTSDSETQTITIKNIHADGGEAGLPWQIDPYAKDDPYSDFYLRNKHVSNKDARDWNLAIYNINGVHSNIKYEYDTMTFNTRIDLVSGGGIEIIPDPPSQTIKITNTGVHSINNIKPSSNNITLVAGDRIKIVPNTSNNTITISYDSGVYVGNDLLLSESEGKATMYSGPKNGYTANIFVNGNNGKLKTGDIVKLKGTPVVSYMGENNLIPITEVTLADKENDSAIIGVVAGKAFDASDSPESDLTTIDKGDKLYVVTLGTFAHCQVDATEPINAGDLLTSSNSVGCAKKAAGSSAPGSIVGKALGSLTKGTGYIPVFINIQ